MTNILLINKSGIYKNNKKLNKMQILWEIYKSNPSEIVLENEITLKDLLSVINYKQPNLFYHCIFFIKDDYLTLENYEDIKRKQDNKYVLKSNHYIKLEINGIFRIWELTELGLDHIVLTPENIFLPEYRDLPIIINGNFNLKKLFKIFKH